MRIRYKALSDGSQSVYLDIYRDGKRRYEFLKLYLIPETSTAAKAQNKATLAAVNTIKSQRIIELTNGVAGLKNTSQRSKMLLLDWMQTYKDSQEKKGVRGSGKLIGNTVNVLRSFNAKAAMRDIDRNFCLALIDYMRNTYVSANGKRLSQFTCVSYFGCLRGALNAAVREDIIGENPINKLNTDEKIKMPESKREFLTIDEVKTLIDTPCRREDVKSAFLFSCYCGLRISDVLALKWKNVDCTGEQWHIGIVMQKTRQPLYLPLSMQARKWMPEQGQGGRGRGGFPHAAVRGHLQRPCQAVDKGGGHYQARDLPREPPHVRHDDADTRRRPLYRLQAARPHGREDNADIRQDYQQEEG